MVRGRKAGFTPCIKQRRRRRRRRKVTRRRNVKRRVGRKRAGKVWFGAGLVNSPKSNIEKLEREIPLLKVLKDIRPVQRAIILASLDTQSCHTVVQCVRKILQNNNLDKRTKSKLIKRLASEKDTYRQIIDSSRVKDRQKLLPRVGGSLPVLLSAALPIFVDIAKNRNLI